MNFNFLNENDQIFVTPSVYNGNINLYFSIGEPCWKTDDIVHAATDIQNFSVKFNIYLASEPWEYGDDYEFIDVKYYPQSDDLINWEKETNHTEEDKRIYFKFWEEFTENVYGFIKAPGEIKKHKSNYGANKVFVIFDENKIDDCCKKLAAKYEFNFAKGKKNSDFETIADDSFSFRFDDMAIRMK